MFKHWSRTLAVLVAASVAGQFGVGLCTAGKPAPPPVPPGPGTICFRESVLRFEDQLYINAQNVWEMTSDGAVKSLAYTRDGTEVSDPSNKTYYGYRWYLTVLDDGINGCDVWAIRSDGLSSVRLTDVAKSGIDLSGDLARARWSSDDDFITTVGADRRLLPTTYHIWYIDISGLEIDSGVALAPATTTDSRFTPIVSRSESINGSYALSPDGQSVVYQTPSGVRLTNVATPEWGSFLRSTGERFDWSPDGLKITFTVEPSVWTMNADGTGAKVVATGKSVKLFPGRYSPRYLHSFWSPDGKWLVFRRDLIVHVDGSQYDTQCDIVEMPAEGGTIINLTGNMDPFEWKLPFAWRPNSPAY